MALAMESSSDLLVPKKLWEYYKNTLELHTVGLTHVWLEKKVCQIKLHFREEREKIGSRAFLKNVFPLGLCFTCARQWSHGTFSSLVLHVSARSSWVFISPSTG